MDLAQQQWVKRSLARLDELEVERARLQAAQSTVALSAVRAEIDELYRALEAIAEAEEEAEREGSTREEADVETVETIEIMADDLIVEIEPESAAANEALSRAPTPRFAPPQAPAVRSPSSASTTKISPLPHPSRVALAKPFTPPKRNSSVRAANFRKPSPPPVPSGGPKWSSPQRTTRPATLPSPRSTLSAASGGRTAKSTPRARVMSSARLPALPARSPAAKPPVVPTHSVPALPPLTPAAAISSSTAPAMPTQWAAAATGGAAPSGRPMPRDRRITRPYGMRVTQPLLVVPVEIPSPPPSAASASSTPPRANQWAAHDEPAANNPFQSGSTAGVAPTALIPLEVRSPFERPDWMAPPRRPTAPAARAPVAALVDAAFATDNAIDFEGDESMDALFASHRLARWATACALALAAVGAVAVALTAVAPKTPGTTAVQTREIITISAAAVPQEAADLELN